MSILRLSVLNGHPDQTGMTIIELLITMLVMAILLAVGIPLFQNVGNHIRMNGEMFAFVADVNFARSEAIKRGQPVWICSSSDGASCNDTTGTSSVWTKGRLIYVDPTAASAPTASPATANILRISPALSHGDTFKGGSAIQVLPTGYAFMTGTATIVDAAADTGNHVCFSMSSGLPTTATGAACP